MHSLPPIPCSSLVGKAAMRLSSSVLVCPLRDAASVRLRGAEGRQAPLCLPRRANARRTCVPAMDSYAK